MKFKLFKITTLARRFMLGVIPVSLAGMIALGASAFYVTRGHIVKSVEKEIEIFSQGTAAAVSSFFRQRQRDLETVSETSLLADYYNNADYGLKEEAGQYRRELERYFLGFAERTGVYIRITYVGPKRREVCGIEGSKGIPAGRFFKSDEVFNKTAALKKPQAAKFPVSEDPVYGPKTTYAGPVFDEAGSFRGIIVMEASLKSLQEILGRMRVGSSGRTYITGSSGKPVLAAVLPGIKPLSSPAFTASVPVEGTDLRVAVTAPMSDFQAPLKAISRFTVFLICVCGALTAFFIYCTIRGLTRPVRKLAEAARLFGLGRAFEKVEVASRDEIGLLARSFNEMAVLLMERKEELESRIRELLVLQGMSASVIEKLDEDHICRVCLKAAVTGLGFERGVLYLVNREGTHIMGRYVHSTHDVGFTEEKMQKRAVPLDGGDILAETARARKPLIVDNPLADPRVNRHFIEEVATKAFCLAPIMTEQKVLGIIGADNYYSGRQITGDQMNNLMLFGNFAALALENAGLVADVRKSEERYRTVLDNSPDAIVGMDGSFCVTVWNRGAQALFGLPPDGITGQFLGKLFEPEAFEKIRRGALKKGFFAESGLAAVSSAGKKLELDVTLAGSGRGGGPQKEWTAVIRDTSERRDLQAQLIQAAKLSAVGQLISGVAHELNNPLSIIMGYSELLYKTGTDPVSVPAGDIADIHESSRRCGEIIKNLLAFVRETRKKKQAVDVAQAVRGAVALVGYKLKKTEGISVTQTFDDDLPQIMADSRQIEQILVNLLQNACDALSTKKGEKKVEIGVRRYRNAVFISVSDNGPGVPEELRSRIFEPFFTTKEEGQGTGLGLAICRRIAEEHGARLTCSGIPGRGATFTLEIPIVRVHGEGAGGEDEAPSKPSPGRKVLVVDDEPDFLEMMRRVLESEGHFAQTASSGPEALEKLAGGSYDLVICDVEMGPAKGFLVREKMLEMNSSAGFIFTTGNLLNPGLFEKLKGSKVPFLGKPFSLAELLSAMNEAPASAAADNKL